VQAIVEPGLFTLDVAGERLARVPTTVGSLAQVLADRGYEPALVLVRLNGLVVADPRSIVPRPGDLVQVDFKVRGA
jgi:hypothetical protein